MIDTITYQSSNSKPNEKWLAYCVIGGQPLLVRFTGATEAEAIERANNWYDSEKKHQNKITGVVELEDDEVASTAYKGDDGWTKVKPVNDGWTSEPSEHGMVGKVWMINHSQQKRARINADELDYYINQGYVKGGPKTQFNGG